MDPIYSILKTSPDGMRALVQIDHPKYPQKLNVLRQQTRNWEPVYDEETGERKEDRVWYEWLSIETSVENSARECWANLDLRAAEEANQAAMADW